MHFALLFDHFMVDVIRVARRPYVRSSISRLVITFFDCDVLDEFFLEVGILSIRMQ